MNYYPLLTETEFTVVLLPHFTLDRAGCVYEVLILPSQYLTETCQYPKSFSGMSQNRSARMIFDTRLDSELFPCHSDYSLRENT